MLLAYNHGLGLRTEDKAFKADLFATFQLHKSVGILVLLLTLIRIWIRVTRPRPAPASDGGWAQMLSSVVHVAFYIIMIGLPLTGWIIVSTSDIRVPTMVFGVLPWPDLPLDGVPRWAGLRTVDAHELLSNAALGLVALHVAGVIRHQFLLRDNIVGRMVPIARHHASVLLLVLVLLVASFLLGRFGPPRSPQTVAAVSRPTVNDVQASRPPSPPPQIAKPEDSAEPVQPASPEAIKKDDANGPADEWRVLPGGTIGFAAVVNGETVQGRFGRWDADITFDPARPSLASLDAKIDLTTATTSDGQRDAMLLEEDFFATSLHPSARFKSQDAVALGSDRFSARGVLTIKGIARATTIDFSLKIIGDTAQVVGSTTINRNDFLVGIGQWAGEDTIANKVIVTVKFAARRQRPPSPRSRLAANITTY